VAKEQVEEFFLAAGIERHVGAMEFWSSLEEASDAQLAREVEEVLRRRQMGQIHNDDASVLFGSISRLRLTVDALAPHTFPWLVNLTDAAFPPGDVLELGCGGGVVSCFLAWLWPHKTVVGVDRSAASLEAARNLAAHLGLTNVTFVKSDIQEVDLGRVFDMVLSAAVWAEMDPCRVDVSSMSAINALPVELARGSSALAACASRHLDHDGRYVSLERCRDVAALGSWVGALRSEGLFPRLGESQMVRTEGVLTGLERLPMLVAAKQGTPTTASELVRWRSAVVGGDSHDELHTEMRVALSGPWAVAVGEVMEGSDDNGTFEVALCLMENGPAGMLYFATTRGVREILAETPDGGAAQFVPMYRAVRNDVGRRASIRSRRSFEDGDHVRIVPALTFAWEQ
jgi:SAM-dependent methyltransferase